MAFREAPKPIAKGARQPLSPAVAAARTAWEPWAPIPASCQCGIDPQAIKRAPVFAGRLTKRAEVQAWRPAEDNQATAEHGRNPFPSSPRFLQPEECRRGKESSRIRPQRRRPSFKVCANYTKCSLHVSNQRLCNHIITTTTRSAYDLRVSNSRGGAASMLWNHTSANQNVLDLASRVPLAKGRV